MKKLPKNREVLARFFHISEIHQAGHSSSRVKEAAKQMTEALCEVWQFHFGNRLVYGQVIKNVGEVW